ncbi:MAG: hypothetical protein K6C97_09775 [Treponema sp.]|nr:hypothetical protein [Treponema sp.]
MKKSKLNFILVVITAIISYLFQSASQQKLFLLEDILTDKVHQQVFSHSTIIILILGILYILFYIIIWHREKYILQRKSGTDICQYIFDQISTQLKEEDKSHIRVTLFKASKYPFNDKKLKFYSRYQIKQPMRKTKVKFAPGQGCAGLCFESQSVIYIESKTEYSNNITQQNAYKREMLSRCNMDSEIIDKLNIKSCKLLGLPIKCSDSGQTWGVILIDTDKKNIDIQNMAIQLQKVVDGYTPFFKEA